MLRQSAIDALGKLIFCFRFTDQPKSGEGCKDLVPPLQYYNTLVIFASVALMQASTN